MTRGDVLTGLQVEDLTVDFRDFTLGPIGFALPAGHVLALIGTNGAGKSTLIRSLLGLQTLASGSVVWEGSRLTAREPFVLADVGYVSDSSRDVLGEFVAEEYWRYRLLAYERARGERCPEAMHRAEHYAALLDFPLGRKVTLRALSLGTVRKAQIIAALMTEPELLILDEPFIGLDFLSSRALESVLRGLRDEGRTVLVSNHDLDLTSRLATSVLVLHQGDVVLDASVEEIGGSERIEECVGGALDVARRRR